MQVVSLPTPAGPREYRVWPAGPNAPAILFLHGTGGTAEWAADEARLPEFCAAARCTLLAPDARRPDPAAPPKFLTNPQRWNDGSTPDNPLLRSDSDDVTFLADVIADAAARGADPRRVFVTGFSNGAGMAFRFAAERRDLIAAVAPVAGYCWVAPNLSKPVPTYYIIGDADPLVPPRGGTVALPWGNRLAKRPPIAHTLAAWAAANGCRPEPALVDEAAGHRVEEYPGPVPVRCATVFGLGHHWPGGKGQLNPRIGGPAATAVSANALLWAFFTRAAE